MCKPGLNGSGKKFTDKTFYAKTSHPVWVYLFSVFKKIKWQINVARRPSELPTADVVNDDVFYLVELPLLLHSLHIAPYGQLLWQLLVFGRQPFNDLLKRQLQLPTVVREGLQTRPAHRHSWLFWTRRWRKTPLYLTVHVTCFIIALILLIYTYT